MKVKKSLFETFCLESSILGLKYLYLYPDKLSRCFWTLNLGMVLYGACVLTLLLYRRFEQTPTRITIENQFEPVTDLPYPAITLCSPNQMSRSSVKHFDRTLVDGNRTKSLESVVPQLVGFYQAVPVDQESLTQLQSLIDLNRYTMTEVMASLPQGCDRFLKMCYFRAELVRCRDLFKPILTAHGLCCVFNSAYRFKDNRRNEKDQKFEYHRVNKSGVGHTRGLIVVTDFEPQDAVNNTILFAGATRVRALTDERHFAVAVMINDWTEFPADDEATLVLPHVESFHLIRATYTYCSQDVKDLNAESRQCYFNEEHHLPFFRQYHNSDCDHLCLTRAVEEQCYCQMFYLPHLRVQNVCNVTSISCIMAVKAQLNQWMQAEQCDCPRDCDSRRYRVDLSIGNLNALPHMLWKPYPGVIFNSSSAIMNFFFPTSTHIKQKQETVLSITTLVSNLGGVFGLCLGCSVMSVFEIFFYFYLAMRNRIKERMRRSWHRKVGYNE